MTVPFSTNGKRASCCNLLNLCISSINNIHFPDGFNSGFFATSIAFFISATPLVTAFSFINLYFVVLLITFASEVFPRTCWSP